MGRENMDRVIIFFDIDGTLLNYEKKLPDQTKQSIFALKERGYEIGVATGRGPFLFRDLIEELNIDTYVSFNGQYVVVKNEVIYENSIPNKILKSLSKFAASKNHPVIYMCNKDMRASTEFHPFIEESMETFKDGHPAYDPIYFEGRDIYQSLLFCPVEEEASYSDTFKECNFIRWHRYSMDVLPAGGSKARGIEAAINHLGIHEDNVYAFGDGLNDIEMLQFVKNSVAMGNAPEPVKKAAKFVTKDVDQGGITHALNVLGLLK
jgi:Cof subfamily protein (haloacid dehalogenase superfamily)